jgi:hypothetical protein
MRRTESTKRDKCSEAERGEGPSPFLQLPLEIRRQIYNATLGLSLADQLSLLSTNRRICDEGLDFIFRRPLKCSSPEQLQAFIDSHDDDALNQVRCLVLRLEDLPPTAMQQYLEKVIMGTPVPLNEHPYVIESQNILSSVQMIPGLRHLSILPPRQQSRRPAPMDLIQHLLSQLPQHLTQLKSLSVSTDIKSLDFLIDFPHLQSLSLSGCSETDPHAAIAIVRQMSSLEELAITGPSSAFLKQQNRTVQKGTLLAVTSDVLSNAPPLRSLTIRDVTPVVGSPRFLTTGMLNAIYDTHRSTLHTLCVSSLVQPNSSVLTLLKTIVLSLSALRELHLEWPTVTSDLLSDSLPTSIQSLTVAVRCGVHAQNIVDELELASHRWPYLRKLHFNLRSPVERMDASVEKQGTGFVVSVRASNRYACLLSVCTSRIY